MFILKYNLIMYLLIMVVFVFTFSFISKGKHLLATLLSLEGLMLFIFCEVYLFLGSYLNLHNFAFLFVSLTACEGAVGLSLLVTIVRSHGGDNFNSMIFFNVNVKICIY